MKKLLMTTFLSFIPAVSYAAVDDNAKASATASAPIQQRDSIPIGSQNDDAMAVPSMMQEMMNNFFNSPMNNDPFMNRGFIPLRALQDANPKMDMYETENDIRISFELPGVEKKDIDLQIGNGMVSLSYQKDSGDKKDKKNYIASERNHSSFQRVVSLPSYAETDKAEAEYKDGVLNITIPKNEKTAPKTKKLEIK